MSATLLEKAPAKINLTLRVLGRRADGYHEIESLVAFADFGDVLTLRTDAAEDSKSRAPLAGRAGRSARIWFSRQSPPDASALLA